MITLALIGKGKWGKNYIRTIADLSNCRLPTEYIKTTDYKDLFSHRDIDGVIIATPSSTHHQIAKDFLERGFNILVEKPLTTNYQDSLNLKRIADKNNNIVMTGHIFVYHPAIVQIKKLLKKVGNIKYIICEGMDSGPIRNDVSSLWDWGPHDISIVLDLLEKFPISVSAWATSVLRPKTKFFDMCFLKLTFPENRLVFVSIGWLSPIKKRNVVIVAENNSIIFDDTSDQKITYIKDFKNKKQISYPKYSHELPLTLEIREFVECIAKRRKPKTTVENGIEVVKIIEKAEESIRQNGKDIRIEAI